MKRSERYGKEGKKPFVDPNHPASVIVLVVNIALKTLVRPLSWRRRQRCPRCSDLHLKAETEQKAIPRQSVLVAPPQWILGQVAEQREASAAKTSNTAGLPAFLMQGNENLPLPELASPALLAHFVDGSGAKVQTRRTTRALSAQTPAHALFSPCFFCCRLFFHVWMCKCCHRDHAAHLILLCSADILYCITRACLSDKLCRPVLCIRLAPQADIIAAPLPSS